MATESWSSHACPRPSCRLFGEAGKGNIRPRAWVGKRRDIRLLWCRACGKRFTERTGTTLFRAKLSPKAFASVAQHVTEGCGVRATGRLCRVAATTVLRVLVRAGLQARRVHNLKVRELRVEAIQIDEKRCAVRGSRIAPVQPPRTLAQSMERMDDLLAGRRLPKVLRLQSSRWDHIAIASREKLVIAAAFGARTADLSDYLVADVKRRINGGAAPKLVESDEYGGIAAAVQRHWSGRGRSYVHAVVNKIREDHRVVKCIRRIVHGSHKVLVKLRRRHPNLVRHLNTSFIERYHRTDRALLAYKQRLTSHLSQKVRNYDSASWLAITNYNFCLGHRTLEGRTPAQQAGIAAQR